MFIFACPLGPASAAAARQSAGKSFWSSSLQLVPKVGYTQAIIFGQGSVPGYAGLVNGVGLEYLLGTPSFSVAPFIEYKTLDLNNTGNTATQREVMNGTISAYGLKAISQTMFLKVAAIQVRVTDAASGTVNNSKEFAGQGLELGAGLTYKLTPYISTNIGLELNYFKIDPATNPISSRLDYTSYTFFWSLRLGLPSGPLEP
jgi:hypothetical protein